MSYIRKVVVAGAGGNLGPSIVSALHGANFAVSVLSRENSASTFPSYINVLKTDYTPPSLLRAFQGQDAVVCTVGPMGILEQIKMIDAAAAVGVKRFIPSEFGADRNKEVHPDFERLQQGKITVLGYLTEKCKGNNNLTWTCVASGPFLDWALLEFPAFGFDIKSKTATIYDSGNAPVTCTTRPSIGIATANILRRPAETANRIVRICSVGITQNKILAAFEEATGEKWNVANIDTKDVLADAREKLKNQQFRDAFSGILAVQLFEDGTTRSLITTPEDSDNELLGVPSEDLSMYIKTIISTVA